MAIRLVRMGLPEPRFPQEKHIPPFKPKRRGHVRRIQDRPKRVFSKKLLAVSNPRVAQKYAFRFLGKSGVLYPSSRAHKKYQVWDPNRQRWVHFGDIYREDFTRHKDPKRWLNYRTRSLHIRGHWKRDKYSPNNLAREILWPFVYTWLPKPWGTFVRAGKL